jgi:putative ABC transport system permease protein
MLKNYILVSFRNFSKSTLFSGINLLGMVLGITCSAILLLYAWSEYNVDRFHTNGQTIYRITTQQEKKEEVGAVTPGPLAPELKSRFPEVVNTARLGKWSGVFKTNNHLYQENQLYFADQSFLQLFDYPLVVGNPKTALLKPTDLLITEAMAVKYFGSDWQKKSDVLGTTFRLNNELDLVVVGILKNPPVESSIQFDFLISFQHLVLNDKWSYQWGSYNFNTFVQLTPNHSAADFESKIKGVLREKDAQAGFNLGIQSLHDIYLHPLAYDYWTKQGNLLFIRVLVIIGFSILVIACFNFINLSTAQSTKRAKEVGIRKTIGASRLQIFFQFLGESFVVVAAAALLSRALIDLTLPYFNHLIGKEIVLPSLSIFVTLFALLTICIGFFASLYPASLLSSFQPIKVLKGIAAPRAGQEFRKVLVVLQFCISFVLMVGTVVIYLQLSYVQSKDLGFSTDQLLYVRLNGELKEKEELFREELKRQSEVLGASASTSTLANTDNLSNFDWEGKKAEDDFSITQINADVDFIPLLGMKMRYGRNLSLAIKSDTAAYIVNESAAKRMGFVGDDVLGKEVTFWGAKGKIIGVVNDFHFRPLTEAIQPFIIRYQPKTFYFNMLVKVPSQQTKSFLAKLPALYKKFDKENPIEFGFVDDQLNNSYQSEQRAGSILLHFCVLSIFITSLGLLGLAAFAAEQRTKEIGIRKILGASVTGIVQLLSKDFMKLIMIAVVLGSPLAWFVTNQWLTSFAYHIELNVWIFIGVTIVSLMVGLITISTQAIKAAVSNPIESLRSE